MRGTVAEEYTSNIIISTLMKVYHQQYSEIMNMGFEECMFLMNLNEAQIKYEEGIVKDRQHELESRLRQLRNKW